MEQVQIKEGDELIIPEISNNVYVYGEISTEGSVMYSPNQDVEYFVNKSGGFEVLLMSIRYILHPNENLCDMQIEEIFLNHSQKVIKVYPGSIILFLETR